MKKQKDIFVLINKEMIPLKKKEGGKMLETIEEIPRIALNTGSYLGVLEILCGHIYFSPYIPTTYNYIVLILSEVEKDKRWEECPDEGSLYREGCRIFKLKDCSNRDAIIVFPPSGLTWGGVPLYREPFVILECRKVPLANFKSKEGQIKEITSPSFYSNPYQTGSNFVQDPQ